MKGTTRRAPVRTALLQAAIAAVAAVLVVAAWVAALVAADLDREQEFRQARAQASNLALNFEEQVHRQFLAVDQTLRILKLDWERDPVGFDLSALQRRAGSLSDVLAQVLVLDARGRVVNGTRRDLIEADFSGRHYFQVHRRSDFDAAFLDGPNRGSAGGGWYISISRRLNQARGVFAGVVVAQFDVGQLTRDFAQADLGPRGLVMLVGRDGVVRASVNRTPRDPGADIGGSALFRAAFNGQNGTWTGPSPLDGVERVHAFRAVPGQDMVMVVGLDRQAALANADSRRQQALLGAAAITVLLCVVAVGIGITLGSAHTRAARLAEDRAVLAAANEELRRARDRADAKSLELETTFAGMSDGISMVDAQFRLASWNHRFPELAGVPAERLRVGMPFEEVLRLQAASGEFGPVDAEREVSRRMEALRTQAHVGVTERQRPNGRTLELRRTSLPDGGFVTLYTDITARKQAEAAQRRARELAEQTAEEKSRFIAIVSHEIRTPLNVSLNALNLLDQSDLTASQRRLVDNGLIAGAALMGLLNDILDLSRMEVGRLVLRPAPFALRPLLDGVVEMYRPIAAERGVQLRLAVGPGVPQHVLTDAGRLRQVLMNLVSNAAKFAEPGPAQLRAGTEVRGGRPVLRLAVRDSGPEIPDLDRARLFRPFSQLERQHPAAGGTGLGLAICQLLASLLGGQIGCDAVGKGGKEFWLTLPLDQVEARDAAEAPPPAAPATAPAPLCVPRTRVLLVEDIPANQLVVATLLRREGHAVDIAGSGEEALRMVQSAPYDLIFMDIFMPGIDGVETARLIRALPGSCAGVPVVALTANVSPENRAEYIRSGFQGVIGKPVERNAMLAALAQFVWHAGGKGEGGRRTMRLPPPPPAPSAQSLPSVPSATPSGRRGAETDRGEERTAGSRWSAPGTAERPAERPSERQGERLVEQRPVLDRARLRSLQGGLPQSIFAGLVDGALSDLRERLPLLREALAEGAGEAAVRVAHAMAGVAGSYGMSALEGLLRQIMNEPVALGRPPELAANDVAMALNRAEGALRMALREEVG